MEDLSTFLWLGIAVVWFLAKLIGRGAKKVAGSRKERPAARVSRPTTARTETPRTGFETPPGSSGGGGQAPPPIVPR